MAWAVSASGTTAALTINSETTLQTDSTNATYLLEVDTSNLALGDALELRVYTATLNGGTLTQVWKGSFQHPQINNHKQSPFVASDQNLKVTIKQTTGTGRTYVWKLLRQ